MNQLAGLAKKQLRDARAQASIPILEGLARRGLLPADPQLAGLADNTQTAEVRHGARSTLGVR